MIVVLVVAFVFGKVGTDALTREATTPSSGAAGPASRRNVPSTTVPAGYTAAAMCKGTEKSIPDAAPWTPGEPTVVASFTYDQFYYPGVWAVSSESDFFATEPLRADVDSEVALTKVALVLCRARGALQSESTCNFVLDGDPTPVDVRFWKRDLRLYEARTGRLVAHAEFAHDSVSCPPIITFLDDRPVTTSDQYPEVNSLPELLTKWTAK